MSAIVDQEHLALTFTTFIPHIKLWSWFLLSLLNVIFLFSAAGRVILLWSGRNQALVPLSVSHCTTIVVGHTALVGLLFAPV